MIRFLNNNIAQRIDSSSLINLNDGLMKIKEQTTYDIDSEQFKYLKREENKTLYRVDINELNQRLNKIKKSNFYTTLSVAILCLSCLIILSVISIKF